VETCSDTSFAQLRILWKNTRWQPFFTEDGKLISTLFFVHLDYFGENWACDICRWRCWLCVCVCVWLLYHAVQLLSWCTEGRNRNISLFSTFVNVFENSLVSKTFTKPEWLILVLKKLGAEKTALYFGSLMNLNPSLSHLLSNLGNIYSAHRSVEHVRIIWKSPHGISYGLKCKCMYMCTMKLCDILTAKNALVMSEYCVTSATLAFLLFLLTTKPRN